MENQGEADVAGSASNSALEVPKPEPVGSRAATATADPGTLMPPPPGKQVVHEQPAAAPHDVVSEDTGPTEKPSRGEHSLLRLKAADATMNV